MKRLKRFAGSILAMFVFLVMLSSPAMADAITNPTFTGVASDVGTGFNIGLGVAVAAGIALLAWALFKRAARR